MSQTIKPTMSTLHALLVEFGTHQIPLEALREKFLSLSAQEAKRAATTNQLPFPVYKAGSRQSQWIVNANDFANYLDKLREDAANDHRRLYRPKAAA